MFWIRASFLLVAVVSMTLCEGVRRESKNDRIDDLLSLMYNMGKRVDSLTDSMKKIYRMEEDSAKNGKEMAKKVGSIEKRIDEVDTDVFISQTKPQWRFIGHSNVTFRDQKTKQNTTLGECFEFCSSWDDFWWIQSGSRKGECACNWRETGRVYDANFLHFKTFDN